MIAVICFILGALLASFVGVIAERAYTGQSWKHGRSRCNSCRRELNGRDLVPMLSWLWYRGRCRQCGAKVPWQYPLSELVLGALFALSYARFGLSVQFALMLPILLTLGFIVIYDLRHTVVPAASSNLLILLCAAFAAVSAPSVQSLGVTLITAALVGFFFLAFYVFSRGRAMGLGDTPVSFALALLAGRQAVPGVMFSFWIGAVIGILILVFRKGGPRMGIEVPFVPFLAAGFLLALFSQWSPLPF